MDNLRRRMSKKRMRSMNKAPMEPPTLMPAIAVSPRDELGISLPASEAEAVLVV